MFALSNLAARSQRLCVPLLALAAGAATVTGCASSQSPSDQPTTAVRTVVQTKVIEKAAAPTTPKSTAPTKAAAASDSFTMPNEVGKGLQAAQDDLQRVSGNPIFFSHSTDASGRGRHQILDADWQVCAQNVAAGTTVDQGSYISFAAVKTSETCP